MIRTFMVCVAALGCLALPGCNAAGALARGGGAEAIADSNSSRAIRSRMQRAQGFDLRRVDIEVTAGIVLLSGIVPRQEDRIEAERIAWTADTVREVANEIRVGERSSAGRNTVDELTAQAARAALLAQGDVRSVNFNVEVDDGVAYLLGVARTEAELTQAAEAVARVNGVQRVVTYVRIEGQPAQ